MIDLTTKFGRHVKRRLRQDDVIWMTTVGLDLTPQPRPVWFLWDGEAFVIFSQRGAAKLRHITAHPKVALSLNSDESGGDVVVLIGEASLGHNVPPANKVPAYLRKYRQGMADLGMTPEEFAQDYSVPIRVIPSSLRGF